VCWRSVCVRVLAQCVYVRVLAQCVCVRVLAQCVCVCVSAQCVCACGGTVDDLMKTKKLQVHTLHVHAFLCICMYTHCCPCMYTRCSTRVYTLHVDSLRVHVHAWLHAFRRIALHVYPSHLFIHAMYTPLIYLP